MIILFTGTVAPPGWALCDGSNGTPDLRGRFVVGIGQGDALTDRSLGDIGGEEKVALTIDEMPSHSHQLNDPGHRHTISASRQLAGTDDHNNTANCQEAIFQLRILLPNYPHLK